MGKISVKHYLNKRLRAEIDEYTKLSSYPLYLTIIVKSKIIKRRSNITKFVTEPEFVNNFIDIPDTKRHIQYECNLITRIIEKYVFDFDNNKVDSKLISFFDLKGYNSKDNFINLLNAYIDFYSHTIFEAISNYCDEEIEKEIFYKLSKVFNIPNKNEVGRILNIWSTSREAEFVYNNLSKENIELFVLRERLRSYLAKYNVNTGYDVPLIDWLDNLVQSDLKSFMKTYKRKTEYYIKDDFIIDDMMIDKFIHIIDSIVNSENYVMIAKSRREIII